MCMFTIIDPVIRNILPRTQTGNTTIKGLVCFSLFAAFLWLFMHVLPKEEPMRLWQLPGQGFGQMMSYVIKDSRGKLYVVDGGRSEDADYLKEFINRQGGRVAGWFITHPHDDHVGALATILTDPKQPDIEAIHGALPDKDFVSQCQPRRLADLLELSEALSKSNVPFHRTSPGKKITIGSLNVEVLSDVNPEIAANCMNNSSVVYRFSDSFTSILFLGDLGVRGGNKLLNGPYGDQLEADIVQMSHHGQGGVGLEVYRRISPSVCLWPTPRWLWDNNGGKGFNTGPWDTVNVRTWMNRLGVTTHYLTADGLVEIK